jgi:hypothetical protein
MTIGCMLIEQNSLSSVCPGPSRIWRLARELIYKRTPSEIRPPPPYKYKGSHSIEGIKSHKKLIYYLSPISFSLNPNLFFLHLDNDWIRSSWYANTRETLSVLAMTTWQGSFRTRVLGLSSDSVMPDLAGFQIGLTSSQETLQQASLRVAHTTS